MGTNPVDLAVDLIFLFPPHSIGQIPMLRTWPSFSVNFFFRNVPQRGFKYLSIHASEDYPGCHDDIDNTKRLTFFRLPTIMEMLHASRRLAVQVTCTLEDVPGEMVTEVLKCCIPVVTLLAYHDVRGPRLGGAGRIRGAVRLFSVSLRQLYGVL